MLWMGTRQWSPEGCLRGWGVTLSNPWAGWLSLDSQVCGTILSPTPSHHAALSSHLGRSQGPVSTLETVDAWVAEKCCGTRMGC